VTVAARRGAFFGVQFHPEKSGPAGLQFLDQCLSRV
jgi:imidazoleglycerol phosphate synthase glutamine amidotransferase subunit HisH